MASFAWGGLVLFFWRARAWLPYYVLGASGAAVLIVVFSREVIPMELWLRQLTAYSVNGIAGIVGLNTTLAHQPGTLMVIGVPHHQEWTNLTVGLESSGLLESSALVGLIAFFPTGHTRSRAATLAIALAASFGANVIRVLIIVAVVSYGGQGSLDFAHIFLGRIAFFFMAMVIYWYAITRPTLRIVGDRLRGAHV
jgi:exosortase family protein XrtG